ncbi:CNNM domain-containing protein [Aeromicrobium sp. CF3.5]|uniref:CNNM domain-containing protein n=1 Tax=Aeromicrobium sp. CF3.5 TaxID=3373078 RepID=UPI003EE7D57D
MNPFIVTLVTIALIVLSAFFVIIEFALLGARRHRLEEIAPTSATARAALRGMNELTIMLAGAQLGITACTLALGAVTKPAIDSALSPVLDDLGLPTWSAGALAFALSLLLVTFLHLVVGEMAPKSWAIAHPERAARLIGIPARSFTWVVRPLLLWVNAIANRLVARTGVEPLDQAAVGGQDAETIRQLVEHSARSGALDPKFSPQLLRALELQDLQVGTLVRPGTPTSVPPTATVADVKDAAQRSGHLRILVDADGPGLPHVVHVRDALLEPSDRPVRELQRQPLQLDADTRVPDALHQMRSTSTQFSVVLDDGRLVGVLTMADLVRGLLQQPEDAPAGTSTAP